MATITHDGVLLLTPDTQVEHYALLKWLENNEHCLVMDVDVKITKQPWDYKKVM